MHLKKEISLLQKRNFELIKEIEDLKDDVEALEEKLRITLLDAQMNEIGLKNEIIFYRNESRP